MLTEIRDRSTGWFAGAIAALIIIPMAFWGIGDYASGDTDPVIIKVGDQKITQQAYQYQLSNAQAEALRNNPRLAESGVFSSDFYKRQILNGMIDNALTAEIAEKQNYRVGDKVLAEYIKKNELFQSDGQFDQAAYDTYVANRSASKTQFENDVRTNTRNYHVRAGYEESALVLPNEVRALLEIQVEQRSFDLITIKQSDYISQVNVSEADINEYYQANIDDFMEPDRTSISYVSLNIGDISKGIELNEEQVRGLYDDNQERYRLAETRDTSHILLSTADVSDADQFAKAQSLVEQLKNGADFSELAKEHSQDHSSALSGGSLGEVEPGAMVPEFDQRTFSLETGVISEPVKTKFGYHIIKVNKVIGGTLQPFEEVKNDIENAERQRLAQEILIERAEQLRNLVFEQPESLEGVASEMGLKVQTTELFARNAIGKGVLIHDSIRDSAFSEQVLIDGLNSEPVEVSNGEFIALRKLDFRASEPKALADVSKTIETQLTNQRASDAAKEAGDSVLATANSSWSSLVNDENISIDSFTASLVDPERKASGEVLREVFKAQLNGASEKVLSFTDQSGDFNIVRLNKVVAGDVDQASEQIKESTRRLVAQRNGLSLFQGYLKGLTEELKSEINEDLL